MIRRCQQFPRTASCLLILLIACSAPGWCQAIRLEGSDDAYGKHGIHYRTLTFQYRITYLKLDTVFVSTTIKLPGQPRIREGEQEFQTNKTGNIVAFTDQQATFTDNTYVLTDLDNKGLYICTRFNDIVANLCKKAHHPVTADDVIVMKVSDKIITLASFIPNDTPYGIPCTIKVRAVSTGIFKLISVE